MTRKCLREELPKSCQDCDYLHLDYLCMDGKHHWSCMMRNMDVRREFSKGKSCCVEDESSIQ